MKVVDLFAGCGGMSLGFQKAGFDIQAAYELWEPAIKCYQNNFKHPIYQTDLRNIDLVVKHISQFAPDMIIGGPPCQDFSHAGKRNEGSNANLTIVFAEIITRVKPTWIVMENVDRAKHSGAYASAKGILNDAGYGLTERVLDASLCGVPQRRKRLFCVGCLGEIDNFLGGYLDFNLACKPMSIRECLGDELGIQYYYRHPRNYSRRAIFSIDEPAPTIRGVNRPVPKGYLGHPGDPIPVSSNIRPLTTLERARIQTFPASFIWTGSKTALEQIIGNAVPVELASFVANAINNYSQKPSKQLVASAD